MRILDLYSGAGGAAVGYARAGFEVVGVDHIMQPRYPFEHYVADALEFLAAHGRVTNWRGAGADHPDLLAATRDALNATGRPWVIENVPEAPLRHDFLLCGSQFGLRVRRHRAFETSPRLYSLIPPCQHRGLLAFEHKGERAYADALGCDWMTNLEARQAVPPAFTQHIGEWLMVALTQEAAA